jgi:hypothetical protein
MRAQLGVHLIPDVHYCGIRKFLWSQAMSQLLVESHGAKRFDFDCLAHLRVHGPFPGKTAARLLDRPRPRLLRQQLYHPLDHLCAETLAALQTPCFIHQHQLEKHVAVAVGIICRRKQKTQQRSAH